MPEVMPPGSRAVAMPPVLPTVPPKPSDVPPKS
jgi:hypothetical protein